MTRFLRLGRACLLACSVLALGGCGSASLVHIEGAPNASITKSTLNHWMQAIAGGDFRQAIGVEGPSGLVSEPADYPRCVAAAKLVSARSFFNQLRPSRAKLTSECRTLYSSVKAQTLSFLIGAQWTIAEAAKHGLTVSDAAAERALAHLRNPRYSTPQSLNRYLTERQWSLSDLLYLVKLKTLDAQLPSALEPLSTGQGQPTEVSATPQADAAMIARTNCQPAYAVPGCSNYHGSFAAVPAPEALLKKLVWIRP